MRRMPGLASVYPRLRASASVSGPKLSRRLGGDDVGDHVLVLPGVEVVHQLGALVAEVAGVLEPGRPFHTAATLATALGTRHSRVRGGTRLCIG